MSEIDNKTEDKSVEINKLIRDQANNDIFCHLNYQTNLPEEIKNVDWLLKVSKEFAGRVLLDEGKNTANIGLNSGAGGFNVTFIETVAGTAAVDDDLDDEAIE